MGTDVKIWYHENVEGHPYFIGIAISGHGAKIPSTSNNRLNFYSQPKEKIISIKNPLHQAYLKEITEAFHLTTRGRPLSIECSLEERLFVQFVLPPALNRADSHNFSKPLMDWLQDVGIISNDKWADAFALRSDDFYESFPFLEKYRDSTLIFIRRHSDCREELRELLNNMVMLCQ
jgi:hypothetical protein